jgi:aryl-alcohol dehydrogenase-like predicted oxidoreductase
MGEHPDRFQAGADVIRDVLDLGVTLIDSAEMYGEGGADGALTTGDLQELDSAFPARQQAVRLGMR